MTWATIKLRKHKSARVDRIIKVGMLCEEVYINSCLRVYGNGCFVCLGTLTLPSTVRQRLVGVVLVEGLPSN